MKILIAGDFCPQHRTKELFEKGEYATVFSEMTSVAKHNDYAIVNMECPVTYGIEQPIAKFGPNLQCSECGIEAVKWAGFHCVTLANNHFLDFGTQGVSNTLEVCRRFGIDTVGGGENLSEASAILYKKIEGKTLAIINCCENEFSIATEKTAGSNPLNPIQQYYAIKEARSKADYVLVIVHGGHEYYQLPSIRMQQTYRFFIDSGADSVVNHHQHCYSGYEIYHNKPIFYGLGNFCFDSISQRKKIWYEGYLVQLEFSNAIAFKILPYIQCKERPSVNMLSPTVYDERIQELNSIIVDADSLRNQQELYYSSSSKLYLNMFEPSNNRLYLALKYRGLIPSFITTKRLLRATNYILCEAHRDKLTYILSNHFSIPLSPPKRNK